MAALAGLLQELQTLLPSAVDSHGRRDQSQTEAIVCKLRSVLLSLLQSCLGSSAGACPPWQHQLRPWAHIWGPSHQPAPTAPARAPNHLHTHPLLNLLELCS